jgi:hypothetical protein
VDASILTAGTFLLAANFFLLANCFLPVARLAG